MRRHSGKRELGPPRDHARTNMTSVLLGISQRNKVEPDTVQLFLYSMRVEKKFPWSSSRQQRYLSHSSRW